MQKKKSVIKGIVDKIKFVNFDELLRNYVFIL